MQGISRLEQLCEELSEEERAKELKQEKKRQKKKNRRKNKCGFDVSEQEAGGKDKSLDEVTLHRFPHTHTPIHTTPHTTHRTNTHTLRQHDNREIPVSLL